MRAGLLLSGAVVKVSLPPFPLRIQEEAWSEVWSNTALSSTLGQLKRSENSASTFCKDLHPVTSIKKIRVGKLSIEFA